MSTVAQTHQAVEHQDASLSESFDVASIKPSDPAATGFAIKPDVNMFVVSGAPLTFLIQYAFDVHEFQLQNIPKWAASARFDIVARMDSTSVDATRNLLATRDRKDQEELLRIRLRSLLKDRFGLEVHPDKKEMPIMHLVVDKGGAKLKASQKNEGYVEGLGEFRCSHSSMESLAAMLSDMTEKAIIDHTNLNGGYAFTLKWTPDNSTDKNAAMPGLFTAVREQLGLKLVPARGSVSTVVIDHLYLPSEN